jgi:ferric-dicitrate binding protein FerR (iron transport regulator)
MLDRANKLMSRLIWEQAAEWLVSLRSGPLSEAERFQYVRWLKQSPAHVRAMLELLWLDGLLRRSNLSGTPPPEGPSQDPPRPRSPSAQVIELVPRG